MSEKFIGSCRMERGRGRMERRLGSLESAIVKSVITLRRLVGWCWKERFWNLWPRIALFFPGLRMLGEHEEWDCSWKKSPWVLLIIQKFRLICVSSEVGFCDVIEIYFLLIVSLGLWNFFTMFNSCPASPLPRIIFVSGAEEINIFCHKWQHHFGSILLSRTSTRGPSCHYHIQL